MSKPLSAGIRGMGIFRGGFTILELLVASALFMMVLALLLGVMSSTSSISSKATGQIEATRIARESLDLIGRDISSASLPWSRTNANSLQFVVNSSNFFNSMFWQAPVVRGATMGNLAIVGYFVIRDLQTADTRNSRFQLRRVYIDPSSTNGDYNIYNTNNSPWLTGSTYSDFGPATAALDNQNAQKGWVADGVLGMWVRCLDKTGGVIASPYDSRSARYGATNWTNSYPSTYPYSRLPAFVEVALVCVAPREIARVNSLPANTLTDPADFEGGVTAYVNQLRGQNPGLKGVTSFTRKFRIYNSD